MKTPYNPQIWCEAMVELGYDSFSVEPDGTAWTGTEDKKVAVSQKTLDDKVAEIVARRAAEKESALGKLRALGLTDREIEVLLTSR